MKTPPVDVPIVCDLSTAPDTPGERMAEYRKLFATVYTGRERLADWTVRFRLRADDGVEAWVRDLAAREGACCAFMSFQLTAVGGEIRWDVAVGDNETARAILDEFYNLPESARDDVDVLADRYRGRGLQFINGDPVQHQPKR